MLLTRSFSSKCCSLRHQITFTVLLFLMFGASPSLANTQYDPTPGSCQIIGDPDVYGQGIRLSFYLQWVAMLLGIFIDPENTNRTRSATNIVTIAVFINSLRSAQVEHSLMVVEWYIVQYLVFWLLIWNLPTSIRAKKSGVGSLFVLCMNYCIVEAFQFWIYWRGEYRGEKQGCKPYIFLFAPIDANSPKWILVLKVLSVIEVPILIVPFLGGLYLLLLGFTKWSDEGEADVNEPSQGLQVTYAVCIFLTGPISIAFVEMTIKKNHIIFPDTSLTNSGQLIPLLIGASTLVSVLWVGLKKLAKKLSS